VVAPAASRYRPVAAGSDGRGSIRPDRMVSFALESDRVVAFRQYHTHYRPSLEPVDGSVLSTSDWSV
jgi:hypothetical protein